jgi:hypothetical protein
MRKLITVIAIIFTVVAIIFSVMPMDTLAFLPVGIALVFSLLLLKKSESAQKMFPKILLFIGALCSVFVLGKTLFIKDKVEVDQKFEQQKIETKQEAKKELEELEGLE